MRNYTILGERIKELRRSKEMTQVDFSKFIGCTQATLSSYENGVKSPSLDIILDIADKSDVSVDWLLGKSNIMNANGFPLNESDMFRYLKFVLDETPHEIYPTYFNPVDSDDEKPDLISIEFSSSSVIDFLLGFKKMSELYNKKLIDYEVFNLWVEKTLNKYKDKPTLSSVLLKEKSDLSTSDAIVVTEDGPKFDI